MSDLTCKFDDASIQFGGNELPLKSLTMTILDVPDVVAPPIQPQTKLWAQEIQAEFDTATNLRELMRISPVFHSLRHCPEVQQLCIPHWNHRVSELAPDAKGKRVVVIDLSAIYHAAFSVCEGKPETTKHTLQMLRNIWAETKPDHFIVALDHKKNWRRQAYAEYKADRPSKPRNFNECLKEVIIELKTKEVQLEEAEGFESDDIMASIAFRGRLLKQKVILVSEDKDLWQCLGPGVEQFRFKYDHKEYRDSTWLAQNHKISPRQAVDWLCMVGKNNIKGANKIGEKTASDYLEKYGSFLGVYEAREELTEKKRASIEELMSRYWQMRKLHTLSVELDVFWSRPQI